MKKLDFAIQAMFSDLNQRTHDAEFDRDFPENGSFRKNTIKGKEYWYYDGYEPVAQRKISKYVGPVSRQDITADSDDQPDGIPMIIRTPFQHEAGHDSDN
jgi:hypothetical protein